MNKRKTVDLCLFELGNLFKCNIKGNFLIITIYENTTKAKKNYTENLHTHTYHLKWTWKNFQVNFIRNSFYLRCSLLTAKEFFKS